MNLFIDFYRIKGLDFLKDDGEMFCYRCGTALFFEDDNCETDRFGRTFCCERCRNIYYGGTDK
jgi:hypothetical protein